jgi:hypothetical protein
LIIVQSSSFGSFGAMVSLVSEVSDSTSYGITFSGLGHHRGGISSRNAGGVESALGELSIWARANGHILLNAGNISGANATGNVGIGSGTPTSKLHVFGTFNTVGNSIIGTDSTNTLIVNSKTDIANATSSTDRLRIGNGSNIFDMYRDGAGFRISSASIIPEINGSISLGDSSFRFLGVFTQGLNANGDSVIGTNGLNTATINSTTSFPNATSEANAITIGSATPFKLWRGAENTLYTNDKTYYTKTDSQNVSFGIKTEFVNFIEWNYTGALGSNSQVNIYGHSSIINLAPTLAGGPTTARSYAVSGLTTSTGISSVSVSTQYAGHFVNVGSSTPSSSTGYGVYGKSSGSKVNYGGYFESEDNISYGSYSKATSGSLTNTYGAYGEAVSTGSTFTYGVYGKAIVSGGGGYGVYGEASSNSTESKYGVYGSAYGTSGTKYGIYGSATQAGSTNFGGYFTASGATTNWGLYVAAGDTRLLSTEISSGNLLLTTGYIIVNMQAEIESDNFTILKFGQNSLNNTYGSDSGIYWQGDSGDGWMLLSSDGTSADIQLRCGHIYAYSITSSFSSWFNQGITVTRSGLEAGLFIRSSITSNTTVDIAIFRGDNNSAGRVVIQCENSTTAANRRGKIQVYEGTSGATVRDLHLQPAGGGTVLWSATSEANALKIGANNDVNIWRGGANDARIGASWNPSANNARTLGTAALRWSTVNGVLGNFSGLVTSSVGFQVGASTGISANISIYDVLLGTYVTMDFVGGILVATSGGEGEE